MTVEVGRDTLEQLEEGQATIRVVADRAGAWLRFPEDFKISSTLAHGLEQLDPPRWPAAARYRTAAVGSQPELAASEWLRRDGLPEQHRSVFRRI